MIREASRIKHVAEYYFVKKLNLVRQMNNDGGIPVLNFGIGSPDLQPSNDVKQILIDQMNDTSAHQYQPYRGIDTLRNQWAKWYNHHFKVDVSPNDELLPLLGSKEGIMHLSMAFLNPNDKVLVPNPGYPAYEKCAQLAGAHAVTYTLKPHLNWRPDLDELAQTDLSNVKLMWVNYPHMPTGATVDLAFFEQLVDFGRKHEILICHDNPYSFILNNNPISILQVENAFPWAIELTSLSKNYNMPGWRIGALVGHKDIINAVLKFKSNMDSGMFKPMQEAAAKALSLDDNWTRDLNAIYKERKNIAKDILLELGCKLDSTEAGMFLWAKTPDHLNGESMSDFILNEFRIFMTPGKVFGSAGENYIRLSLCSPMSDFEEAMRRIQL